MLFNPKLEEQEEIEKCSVISWHEANTISYSNLLFLVYTTLKPLSKPGAEILMVLPELICFLHMAFLQNQTLSERHIRFPAVCQNKLHTGNWNQL